MCRAKVSEYILHTWNTSKRVDKIKVHKTVKKKKKQVKKFLNWLYRYYHLENGERGRAYETK